MIVYTVVNVRLNYKLEHSKKGEIKNPTIVYHL